MISKNDIVAAAGGLNCTEGSFKGGLTVLQEFGVKVDARYYWPSRKECQNTLYDLLGVRYDPAKQGEWNVDTLWHGFAALCRVLPNTSEMIYVE